MSVSTVHALKEKNNLSYQHRTWSTHSTAGTRHALTLRSEVSHRVMKCAAGVGMHVDIMLKFLV